MRWFARASVLLPVLLGLLAAPHRPAAAIADPSALAWRQHPGAALPGDLRLRDRNGVSVPLDALLAGRPAVLDLGYFRCPSLCGVVRADLMQAVARAGLRPGRDFSVLVLSIDPAEGPEQAREAEQADRAALAASGAPEGGWRYLTGAPGAIDAVMRLTGFPARADAGRAQFLHPAGLVLLTPRGVVSSYLLGVGYAPGDLRAGLVRAGGGGVARAALPVLLLCFHYDPVTGRYSLAIVRVLRLLAALTVLTLGCCLWLLHRRRARA